jgi:hypothetical protein
MTAVEIDLFWALSELPDDLVARVHRKPAGTVNDI